MSDSVFGVNVGQFGTDSSSLGTVYYLRGKWDPTTEVYPENYSTNSLWMVDLPSSVNSYVFNNITWREGDFLVYDDFYKVYSIVQKATPLYYTITGDGTASTEYTGTETITLDFNLLDRGISEGYYSSVLLNNKGVALSAVKGKVNVKQYGAIGDGTLHTVQEWIVSGKYSTLSEIQGDYPSVTSLGDSIDAAALQKAIVQNPNNEVFIPAGVYLIDKTIYVTTPLVGDGPLSGWRSAPFGNIPDDFYNESHGTNLILIKTGPRVHTIDYVTSSKQCGFNRPNPNRQHNNQYDAEFNLLDLTYQNAVGTNKASLRPFSAGFVVGTGETNDLHVRYLRDLRIVPSCPGDDELYGVKGYNYKDVIRPWDEWDIGVWFRSPWRNYAERCQIVGYYMLRGLLMTEMAIADDQTSSDNGFSEFFKLNRCIIQGGYSSRSGDIWPILSKTVDTLTVEWTASHTFNTSGILRTSNSGNITYTGLSYDSLTSTLTFTGCSSTDLVVVNNDNGNRTVIRTTTNGGTANSVIEDCEINDFSHMTRVEEQSVSFAGKQMPFRSCLEVSGHPSRGLTLKDTSLFGTGPVVIHFGNVKDTEFYSCYSEPKTYKLGVGGVGQPPGAAFILGPKSTYFDKIPNYDRGYVETYGKTFTGYVNMVPELAVTSTSRLAMMTDCFNPRGYFSTQKNLVYSSTGLALQSNNGKTLFLKVRNDSTGGSRTVFSSDYLGNVTVGPGFNTTTLALDNLIVRHTGTFNRFQYESTSSNVNSKVWEWQTPSVDGTIIFKTRDDTYQDGNTCLTFTRNGTEVTGFSANSGFTQLISNTNELDLRSATSYSVRLRNGSATALLASQTDTVSYASTSVRSNTDNTVSLGTSSNKWSVVYAGTGTINVSDINLKTEILPITDIALDAWEDVEWVTYKFKDSVASKGSANARKHTGLIAQQVIQAFANKGLNAFDYGVVCYDTWDALPEIKDNEGNIIQEAREAGSLYSVRYQEAEAFEAAYVRKKLKQLEGL